MGAQYLLRFDDICPTMSWRVWSRVEEILLAEGVKPILAVVPDNRDPTLEAGPARVDFWEQVREWQTRGWTVGWHGYQHLYSSASRGILGIHSGSEFAGHPAQVQRRKLQAAANIFRQQQVTPRVFVAPGHAFDETTVKILREFGITTISDGFYWRPVERAGSVWLPQQLWRFRRMPFGLWTICLHINAWHDRDLERFVQAVRRFRRQVISFETAAARTARAVSVVDRAFGLAFGNLVRTRLRVKQAPAG